MNHRRAIELLTAARVYCPAVVPALRLGGGFLVYSGAEMIGKGQTVEAAYRDAIQRGNVRELPPFPPFRESGLDIERLGEVVATARTRTMAIRIANALNLYHPTERKT